MLTVSNSTLSGNSADDGGGIYNQGTLTVSTSTLSGNIATGYYGGGGIYNGGRLTVSNSTLSGNSATYSNGSGGGIYTPGTLTVSNSTLSGNTSNRNGGGILCFGPVTLTNVTITANRANNFGGGLYVDSGTPVLHNTLIAGNFNGATGTIRDDVYGALNSAGDYNLIGDGTRMTGLQSGVNGNLVGSAAAPIDPRLGPLQDNGGPTKTHALLAGSPALITGSPAQLGVADQRGVVRRGGVNIGAYQASASAFVVTVPGTVASGTPFDVTVQAVDQFGQVAFGYRGTVTFSVTDPDLAVVLPADYTFTAGDQGTHTFTGQFTLITPGTWTLTTEDRANGLTKDVMLTVDS
jgi:predicted outer membrane repeat protein